MTDSRTSQTEQSDSPKGFIKGLARLVLYTGLALSIFFGVAVLIFVLRGEDTTRNSMPDLVGKNYIDVHADLVRLQLRVQISKRSFADQGSGVILYQSITTGTTVQPREKLALVINQPEPLLVMPELKQSNLEAARASLDSIVFEERVYKLDVAAVTELESDSYPDNTVLAQFPETGSIVQPDQKVYLLVARKPGQTKPVEEIKLEEFVGQNAAVLMDYLGRRGLDYRIKEIKDVRHHSENARVTAIQAGSPMELTVNFTEPEVRFKDGWELLEVELDEPGRCVAEVRDIAKLDEVLGSGIRQVFVTQNHKEDEEVQILFYRHGTSEVTVSCGEKVVYSKTIEPDDLG